DVFAIRIADVYRPISRDFNDAEEVAHVVGIVDCLVKSVGGWRRAGRRWRSNGDPTIIEAGVNGAVGLVDIDAAGLGHPTEIDSWFVGEAAVGGTLNE